MAYVFTNTITTLPYGYYVKVLIIADSGVTSSLTASNGGYIVDIGDIEQAIDDGKGAIKPGSVTLKLRNVGEVFSDNVFTAAINSIELRIAISYDAGSTYEWIFAGFIEHKFRAYKEKSSTDLETRIYEVTAHDAIIKLRETAPDYTTNPVGNLITVASLDNYHTDDNGTAVQVGLFTNPKLATLYEILLNAIQRIPFISGATAPTIAIDVASGGMTLYNDNGATVTDSTFGNFCLVYELPAPVSPTQFVGTTTTRAGAVWRGIRTSLYDAENYLEILRRLTESCLFVPIPRLTESGGAFTYTVYFEPFLGVLSGNAVAGTLGDLYVKDFKVSQWYDAVQINTINLPLAEKSESFYGGKNRELNNYLVTSPVAGGTDYVFTHVTIIYSPGANSTSTKITTDSLPAQQLFIKTGAATAVIAHKFKHLTSQALYEAAANGYYGVQKSMHNLAIADTGKSLITRGERLSLTGRYKTLKGTDLWDLRPNKTITIDSVDYKIYSIKRNLKTNSTDVELLEEA